MLAHLKKVTKTLKMQDSRTAPPFFRTFSKFYYFFTASHRSSGDKKKQHMMSLRRLHCFHCLRCLNHLTLPTLVIFMNKIFCGISGIIKYSTSWALGAVCCVSGGQHIAMLYFFLLWMFRYIDNHRKQPMVSTKIIQLGN